MNPYAYSYEPTCMINLGSWQEAVNLLSKFVFYKPDVQYYYSSFPLIPERSPLCSIGNEGYGIIYTYYTTEHHNQAFQRPVQSLGKCNWMAVHFRIPTWSWINGIFPRWTTVTSLSPIPTLWKMNVDSVSAFFLEATCMNHKQLLPQQPLQVRGPQKSRDPLACGDGGCLAMAGCITPTWWSGQKAFANGCYFLWQEYRIAFDHKVLTAQINFLLCESLRFADPRPVETGEMERVGSEEHLKIMHVTFPGPLALMAILVSYTHQDDYRLGF